MSVINGRALGYLLFALTLRQSCFDYDCVDKRPKTHTTGMTFHIVESYHKVWPKEKES